MKKGKVICVFFLILFLSNGIYAQILNNPVNLVPYRTNEGSIYSIRVTGTDQGSVWGGSNGIYTDDSRLGKAAVHAGLLKIGESGVLKVTILAGQASYAGSTTNGISTAGYGAFSGSFKFVNDNIRIIEPSTSNVLNDPVNLATYRKNQGTTYSVNVTGTNQGSVWGGSNGIYTDDSRIGKAAVHAGLLKVGEVGILKVTILSGQPSYSGSTKNGITTAGFGSYGGSFRFENVAVSTKETSSSDVLKNPVILGTYRKNQGTTYSVNVTGTNQGSVWGGSNGIYTDDSGIGKAAVHAGLLKVGETGVLKVTILPGQSSYTGSTKNGISSFSFGSFGGSFRFESNSTTIIENNQEVPKPVSSTPTTENKKGTENNSKTSGTETKTNTKQTTNKTEPITQPKKPTTATQTVNLEAMTDIPPSKPLPFLDITTLSKTEWDGAVSAAMEGMRLVYGPMTDSENKQFEKSWAPLRHIPFKEAVDYLNKFNPLLGEFLTYRTAVTQTSSLMEEATKNAGYAAEYDDPQSSLAYFDLAKKYQTLLISRQKRLQQITNDLIALGNPPNGTEHMAERQHRYIQEKDYLKSLVKSGATNGCGCGPEGHNSDCLFAVTAGSGTVKPKVLSQEKIDQLNKENSDQNSTIKKSSNQEKITDRSNSGENYLHIIDDKNPADRKKIDAEAIEFHNTNLAIIQKNIARDQQDLAKEKDPQRRKDYEMRILGAQANIQAEKDRIATIQTGIIVFNRSPWDDYAKSNFIQNIAKNQRTMENISRGVRKAYEQADRLPDEEARKVREIINTKYSGKIMANLDEKAAKAIIEEANSVGKKYYQGKIDAALANNKDALAEAAWADACLQTAEIVKTTADYSMMGLSMFGGQYVNNAYQGITGYIDGGPKEAFLRVAGSYNTITGVAVDGFRGFEDAVNKGGDFVDGFMGAGWEAAKGLITDKAMAFGVGKISGSFNRPNGNLPHIDGPSKTGQSAGNPSATRKVPRVGEPDFNRPLTAQEIAVHREQIADGRIKVNSYKNTFEKLETARKAGAPPSEIKKILIELDDRSAKIHSSPQAKMMMKTMQKQPKNLDMIKRYSNSMDRIHQKVEKRYHAEMQKNGWSPEELQAIRNKPDPADLQKAREMQAEGKTVDPMDLLGSKTVNMDYDAGRKATDANGNPIPPMKNGKAVPVEAWHKEAQDAWERAYEAETGQNAKKSWENITHGKIPDAYADLNVLQKNGILQANKQWAGQTADVTYYKAEHLRGQAEFLRVEKYVEIARGTSKDYRTKMEPLFNQKKPPAGTPSFEAWQKHKNYWDKVNGVLNDMGSGKKDPMTADREIRQLSGGKSVLEVTFDMRNFMESLLLLGTNN